MVFVLLTYFALVATTGATTAFLIYFLAGAALLFPKI